MNSLMKKSVEIALCCEKNKSFKILNYVCVQKNLSLNEIIKKHYSTNNTLSSASKSSKVAESTSTSKTSSIFTSDNKTQTNKKADNISRAMSYYLEKLSEKGLQSKISSIFPTFLWTLIVWNLK